MFQKIVQLTPWLIREVPERNALYWKLFFIILLSLSILPIRSHDLYWHIATGRYIHHHGIPEKDPFSFASEDIPWINHAWGFDRLIAPLSQIFYPQGLLILRVVMVGILGVLLYKLAGSFLFTLWLLALMRHRFYLRPELIALLYLGGILWLFKQAHPHRFWIAGGILILWVNTHASFLLGVVILAYFAFKEKAYLWLIPAFFLPLLNPYLWEAYIAPINLIGAVQGLKAKQIINPEWLSPPFPYFYPFYLFCAAWLGEHFSWKKLKDHALGGVGLLMGVFSLRHIGFSTLLMGTFWKGHPRGLRWVYLPLLLLSLGKTWITLPPGWGVDKESNPVTEGAFIQKNFLGERGFNLPGDGGYLIWLLFPHQKIFIDGRNELYLPLLETLDGALKDSRAWQRLQDTYGFSWAFLPYLPPIEVISPEGKKILPPSQVYFPNPPWHLVFYGDRGMVFGKNPSLPALHYPPEDLSLIFQYLQQGIWTKEAVLQEWEKMGTSHRVHQWYQKVASWGEER